MELALIIGVSTIILLAIAVATPSDTNYYGGDSYEDEPYSEPYEDTGEDM